jgi:hypothetical protein
MEKFGSFDGSVIKPMQVFEGEYLENSGEIVSVMAKDGTGTKRTVAVIRLAQGQSVKTVG